MKKTAESVTPHHPDKLCDQISDLILDAFLEEDPESRVAVETMGKSKNIYISGEVTSKAVENIDIEGIIKTAFPEFSDFKIVINLTKQSQYIAQGVDIGGAGDQGIMKGYATSETKEMVPLEILLSRNLARHIYGFSATDGKTQVTLEDGKIKTVVASFQNIPAQKLQELVREAFPELDKDAQIFTNPAGDWAIGGFEADAGQTGRKLVVDNYGPQIAIGGGCFSGKDATKVDRSAAYMARKVAVDYLVKKGAKEVFVDLAYSIGIKEPVQAIIRIDGREEDIKGYDLSPKGIIEFLDLRKPQYLETAKWGHFGNNFLWDLPERLK